MTSLYSFFWNTDLSEERRMQIIEWYASLSPDEKLMVDQIRRDAREDAEFEACESEDI